MEQVASRRVVRRVFSPDLLSPVQVQVEPKKLVVAAYARVSTEKEQQENSYERQVEHYTALIKANDAWEFGGIYADPGISGTRAEKRPEFMRMIADCRAGKIDKILAKSISRFARNTVDTLSYIRELRELGIGVCFENEHIDTLTPGGEVLLTILAAIAEQESRTMSTNIKWTYQKKFQNGEVILSTGTMLGYTKDADGNYVINESEAEIVRRVFREYIAGASLTQIRHGLETDGIKTKRGCSNWRANGILGIIKNEKYTGNALLGKTYKPDVLSKRRLKNTGQAPLYYVENTHPAIISQEVFDMAQAEMRRRDAEKDSAAGRSHYASKYPFSGLLVCGCCGHKLRRHVRSSGGRVVAAWACTNRIQHGREVCDSHHLNEDVLITTYRAALASIQEDAIQAVLDAGQQVLGDDNTANVKIIEEQIVKLQEEALELHRARQNDMVPDEEYEAQVTIYSQRMEELQAQQKQLKADATRRAEALHWLDSFQQHMASGKAYNAEEACVMREMVDQIIVYDDRLEIQLRCGVTLSKKLLSNA